MAPRHFYLSLTVAERPGNLTLQAAFIAVVLMTALFGLMFAPAGSATASAGQSVQAAGIAPAD